MSPQRFNTFLASPQLAERLEDVGVPVPTHIGSNSRLNVAYGVDHLSPDVAYTGEHSATIVANTYEDEHVDSGWAVIVVGPYIYRPSQTAGGKSELTMPCISAAQAAWLGSPLMEHFIDEWAKISTPPEELTGLQTATFEGTVINDDGIFGTETITPFQAVRDETAQAPLSHYGGTDPLTLIALEHGMPLMPRLRQTLREPHLT